VFTGHIYVKYNDRDEVLPDRILARDVLIQKFKFYGKLSEILTHPFTFTSVELFTTKSIIISHASGSGPFRL
jgi:hypothetical protein